MEARVEDGKVVSLKGDPNHPMTKGFICRKMKSYPEKLYSHKRISTPLLCDGEKGSGKFKKISWDEAWKILTEKLHAIINQFGGEAVLPFCYAGNMGKVNRNAGFPLFHKIGATRIEQTICSAAAVAGWKKQCGSTPGSPAEKVIDSDLVICWGINAKVTNVHFWQMVVQAKKQGAKLVVIDPYKNSTGGSADFYFPVKPGGDSALALGIIKYLIETQNIATEHLYGECDGFDTLQPYLEEVPWSQLVDLSGLAYSDFEKLVQLFMQHPKTFIRIGVGLTRNSRGAAGIRSIASLAMVLGLFSGDKGKGVMSFSGAFKGGDSGLTHEELLEDEPRTINMIQLGKALTAMEPPVKLLMVYNANPLSVAADTATVRTGLLREDLFTVVHEHTMTPTAKYADLILPATTFLENRDVYTSYGHYCLKVVDRVIEPIGMAMSNFDFFQTLARKMGYTDPAFQESTDERIYSFLQEIKGLPDTITVEECFHGKLAESNNKFMDEDLLEASGNRFSFVPESNIDGDTYPFLGEGAEFDHPDLVSRFPLKLITPPHEVLLNSTFGERYEDVIQEVLIHPVDAKEYGIDNHQLVVLSNNRGEVKRKAVITEDTQQGLVVAEGIFWPDQYSNGVNDLTSQKLSDLGGGSLFHEARVALKQCSQ